MLSLSKRAQAAVISTLGVPIVEGLGGTYTWRSRGLETLDEVAREGRQPIFAFWHGRILGATLYFRDRDIVVITSENFDGEWIARLIRHFGYDTARGSTSRGGARALVQLRREMNAGRPVAFTVDGPRGPARSAQPGAVWLASATGQPVVPFHMEASSFWTARSWDRHQVPKPGALMAVAIGQPIDVPTGADDQTIEMKRQDLERALGRLEEQARALLDAGSRQGH